MSKHRKTVVPDFSSKKASATRALFGKAVPAPVTAPKAPVVKPQATSAKSGHRGQ